MEIQIKVVSCCKFWIYLVGVNHKFYSRHVVNFVFIPTQLIYNMTVDIPSSLAKGFAYDPLSLYMKADQRFWDFRNRSTDVSTKYRQQKTYNLNSLAFLNSQ